MPHWDHMHGIEGSRLFFRQADAVITGIALQGIMERGGKCCDYMMTFFYSKLNSMSPVCDQKRYIREMHKFQCKEKF